MVRDPVMMSRTRASVSRTKWHPRDNLLASLGLRCKGVESTNNSRYLGPPRGNATGGVSRPFRGRLDLFAGARGNAVRPRTI
eukprot:9813777-Prorocentrum_lima.AAC.1